MMLLHTENEKRATCFRQVPSQIHCEPSQKEYKKESFLEIANIKRFKVMPNSLVCMFLVWKIRATIAGAV